MNELKSNICIIDDDPSVRASLSLLLNSAGFEVKCFQSAKVYLENQLNELNCCCLILDVKMPELSGLDLQKELAKRNYSFPIIFITGHGDIPMSVQAMKDGAVDFLSKPFDDEQLLKAVSEAIKRSEQISKDQGLKKQIQQKLDNLTSRENEVLKYLITGMLNKQIAYELNISERTIKAHRKQVFDKLDIKSMAELVRITEQMGIKPVE